MTALDARRLRQRLVLFAVAYFLASEVGYALSLGVSVGGTFWPSSGLCLAILLVDPARLLRAIADLVRSRRGR